MDMKTLVAPSILACDFSRLCVEISCAERAGADYVHVDVMDGHFVPNITLGPPIVEKIRKCSTLPFDVHLMIDHPEVFAPQFVEAGADIVTIHVESPGLDGSESKTLAVLEDIITAGAACGVVVKPGTPAEAVFPYLGLCKMVLVMTVEPGFGGQSFMQDMLPKIRQIRQEAERQGTELNIEVDGGIVAETAHVCYAAGANVFVAGTFLFGQDDIAERIASLHELGEGF